MKNLRRVICSVLAAVMVLAALPLCTALAATEITSIELSTSDYIEPSVGMTIPRSGASVTSVNGNSSLKNVISVSCEWSEVFENGASGTPTTSTFQAGREYNYSISVSLKSSGYVMTGGVKININGKLVQTINGKTLSNYSCVLKSVKFEGGTFTITYKPDYYSSGSQRTQTKQYGKAVTLLGAIFTRSGYNQIGWSRSSGGTKSYNLGESYDKNYDVTLYPVWEKAGVVTISSMTLDIQGYAEPYPGDTVPAVKITVTDINGASPSGKPAFKGEWRKRASNGGYTVISSGSKFETGSTYGLIIDLTLAGYDDFKYADSVNVTINGDQHTYSRSILTGSSFILKNFTVPAVVSSVIVSRIVEPVGGKQPAYTGLVGDSSKYRIANYTNSYGYKNGILWYDTTLGKPLASTGTFVSGHTYRATVFLEPLDGYIFLKNKSSISARLNGVSVTPGGVYGEEKYISLAREFTVAAPAYEKGDADRSGQVGNSDLILVARHAVHLTTLTGDAFKLGDMNDDNIIDNTDIIRLARKLVNLN